MASSPLSRRIFLKVSGASALATAPAATHAVTPPNAASPRAATSPAPAASAPSRTFFSTQEAAFIEAAVERLIPPDAVGPSALEAGVPEYIDRQLSGAWGAGERLYRGGPWATGQPTQGYQLPLTPAELFHTALRGIRDDLQRRGSAPFEQLPGDAQDRYLTQLQTLNIDLGGVPSKVFFESLLGLTVEGYFCDPAYGGNKDMAAWKMIGFPGAYAAYYDLVDQHGLPFTAAPRSLAEGGAHTAAGHGPQAQPAPPPAAEPAGNHKGH